MSFPVGLAFPVCVRYECACLVVAVVYVFVTDSEAQAPRLASRGYHSLLKTDLPQCCLYLSH